MSIAVRNHGGPITFVVDAVADLATIVNPRLGQFALAMAEGTLWYHTGTAWTEASAASASGAPTTADYLVGTANAGLSAEIAVGTSPGGELGGTWAAPTVDSSHAGGTHAATQAAAESTAASAASTHAAAADPHTGYVLESLLDAKGDLITASADNTPAKLTVGSNGKVPTADSNQTGGIAWEAKGTGAQTADVVTSETTTSTTYTDLTTPGPAVTATVGISGMALVIVSAQMSNNTASDGAGMSFTVTGGAAAADVDFASTLNPVGSTVINWGVVSTRPTLVTGLTPGSNTFTAKYRVRIGGTATFFERRIIVIPL